METLFTEVGLSVLNDQKDAQLTAIQGKTGDAAVFALAESYRIFARSHAALYQLIMQMPMGQDETLKAAAAMTAEPSMLVLQAYPMPEERRMHWQRVLRGVMHGFVSQEAAGYFSHYPVNLDESYHLAIQCVVDGLHREVVPMNNERVTLFSETPIQKAVLTLAVPTVISQLITVVYNMADTFFIGRLNDLLQVAAATIAMPCFMLLTGFANLFGLGGYSLISRCLGTGDTAKARHCSSFCILTGAAVALLYGILIVLLEPVLLPILGANQGTWKYCQQYIFWTIGIGAVPTVMNAELAHLIRAEGYSKNAGFGVAFGGILNIFLDPVFIFGFHLNIQGAAIATMLSNLIAMGYFLGFLFHIRKRTVITWSIREFSVQEHLPLDVLSVGLPGFIMTMMSTISNATLNHIVAGYRRLLSIR